MRLPVRPPIAEPSKPIKTISQSSTRPGIIPNPRHIWLPLSIEYLKHPLRELCTISDEVNSDRTEGGIIPRSRIIWADEENNRNRQYERQKCQTILYCILFLCAKRQPFAGTSPLWRERLNRTLIGTDYEVFLENPRKGNFFKGHENHVHISCTPPNSQYHSINAQHPQKTK